MDTKPCYEPFNHQSSKNWLRISSVHAQKGIIFYTVPFSIEHLPLIIIPKNKNEPFRVHWWTIKDTILLDNLAQKGLKCLFNKEQMEQACPNNVNLIQFKI